MSIGDVVLASVGDYAALIVNFVVRLFDLPEIHAKKVVFFVEYLFVLMLVSGLVYITFKYS